MGSCFGPKEARRSWIVCRLETEEVATVPVVGCFIHVSGSPVAQDGFAL